MLVFNVMINLSSVRVIMVLLSFVDGIFKCMSLRVDRSIITAKSTMYLKYVVYF